MESQPFNSNNIKPFTCPFHPSEEIQRVCLDLDAEHSLQCIECVLHTKNNYPKDRLYPLADFITSAATQYKIFERTLSFHESPPNNLVDFLVDEEKKTKALEEHIEREKQRVEESFNSILHEFTLICHKRKEEILKNLDMQLVLLKNNYKGYKSKIDKYYNGSKEQEENNKESIIERINKCQDASDFEILVRNIKEDIVPQTLYWPKAEEIKDNWQNFAQELNRQSNTIPRVPFNDLASTMDQVKELMEELGEINDPIVDICEGVMSSFDSKIIKKPQDSVLLGTWLGSRNKLKLLYRGTRDKFDASIFHERCDEANSTLTIARSSSGNIFGGFTDQSWKVTNNYKESKDSWLFSIDHHEKYPIKLNQQATYPHQAYGPTFGSGFDLYINLISNGANCQSNLGNAYKFNSKNQNEKQSRLAGSFQFNIEEIEVFAVTEYSRGDSNNGTIDS